MADIVEAVMVDMAGLGAPTTIEDVFAADAEARRRAMEKIGLD